MVYLIGLNKSNKDFMPFMVRIFCLLKEVKPTLPTKNFNVLLFMHGKKKEREQKYRPGIPEIKR
jgi:hypothetical protein